MIISFIYCVILSKFINSSFPQCNVHTGVQSGCLAFTPLDGYLKLWEMPFCITRNAYLNQLFYTFSVLCCQHRLQELAWLSAQDRWCQQVRSPRGQIQGNIGVNESE